MNKKVAISFLFFFFSACGGGGGGSSGDSGQTGSISYSGSTSQATIDNTNAKTLASDSYSGGSIGGGFASKPADEGQTTVYSDIYNIATETLQKINQNTSLTKPYEKTVTASDTKTGSCGGTASYILTGDDTTGTLSGTFTFVNYCSLGVTENGTIDITASYNSSSGTITSMTLTFNNFSLTSTAKSYTITGTFILTSSTLTMNCVIKNNNTSKIGKFENVTYIVTNSISYAEIIMSGRIYHPDNGYIDITTQTPFKIYLGDSYPSSGVMTISGANSKSAKLTTISNSQYNISADLEANGSYETDIGTYSWGS